MISLGMPLNLESRNLKITKDNYKGYLELYQLMLGIELLPEEWQEYNNNYSTVQLGIDTVYRELKSITKKLTEIDIKKYDNPIISLSEYDIFLEEQKNLKDVLLSVIMLEIKYPYLDGSARLSSIEYALLQSKLLLIKNENSKYYYKLDYKGFKRNLRIQDIIDKIEPFEKYKSVTCFDYKTPYVRIKKGKQYVG